MKEQEPGAPRDPKRRKFLRQAGIAGASLAAGALAGRAEAQEPAQDALPAPYVTAASVASRDKTGGTDLAPLPMTNTGLDQIPHKPLGATGEQVSIIGLGGATLGQAPSYEEAEQILHEAVDAGVTFLD